MKKTVKKSAKKAPAPKKKAGVLKKKAVAVKKAVKKVASLFQTVPSYAGSGKSYQESVDFPGFRVRSIGSDVRIHVSKSACRNREEYVAMDIPKTVLRGLVDKIA